MAKTIFTYEESPYHPGFYKICIKHDNFYLAKTDGSYNVIMARLMNLKYADYLRFCRDILGATLIGKGTKYVVPYFKKGENLFAFIKLLNARANFVIFEREHPNYEQHKKEVENYKAHMWEVTKNVSNN